MTAAARLPGIFCLEGEWDEDLNDRTSVRPILDLLAQLEIAQIIHRDVATRSELSYYLSKLDQPGIYDDFKVINLAMHGSRGLVDLGSEKIRLPELQEMLEGRCSDRVVYFGSCLTLRADDGELQQFAKATGARAVVGYGKAVDWLDSAAFEVLLLDRLVSGLRSDAIFNRLARDHGNFAATLGLVVATKSTVRRTAATRLTQGS